MSRGVQGNETVFPIGHTIQHLSTHILADETSGYPSPYNTKGLSMLFRRYLATIAITLGVPGPLLYATDLTPALKAAGFLPISKVEMATDFQRLDHQRNTLSLKDLRQKVILLNFWATWCIPCVHEMPVMDELQRAMRDKPLAILAANMQERKRKVAKFMKRKGFKFSALIDEEGEVAAAYQVRALPTTVLIDCAGKQRGSIMGVLQWTHEAMHRLLDELFKEPACQ